MANAANPAQQLPLQQQTLATPAEIIKRNRTVCLTASSAFIVFVSFCMIWSQVYRLLHFYMYAHCYYCWEAVVSQSFALRPVIMS